MKNRFKIILKAIIKDKRIIEYQSCPSNGIIKVAFYLIMETLYNKIISTILYKKHTRRLHYGKMVCIMNEEQIKKMKDRHKAGVDICASMNIHPSKEYELQHREDVYTKAVMDLDHLEEKEARVIAKEIIAMEAEDAEDMD